MGLTERSESGSRGKHLLLGLIQPRPLSQEMVQYCIALPLLQEMEQHLRLCECGECVCEWCECEGQLAVGKMFPIMFIKNTKRETKQISWERKYLTEKKRK